MYGTAFTIDGDANDNFTLGCIFDGVINKIVEYFLNTHGIDRDWTGNICSGVEVNFNAFVSGEDVKLFDCLSDECGPINIFFVEGHGVTFDFGGSEE